MKQYDKAKVERLRARLATPQAQNVKEMIKDMHGNDLLYATLTIIFIMFVSPNIESSVISKMAIIPLLACCFSIGIGLYLLHKRESIFGRLFKDNATFEEAEKTLPLLQRMFVLNDIQTVLYFVGLVMFALLVAIDAIMVAV